MLSVDDFLNNFELLRRPNNNSEEIPQSIQREIYNISCPYKIRFASTLKKGFFKGNNNTNLTFYFDGKILTHIDKILEYVKRYYRIGSLLISSRQSYFEMFLKNILETFSPREVDEHLKIYIVQKDKCFKTHLENLGNLRLEELLNKQFSDLLRVPEFSSVIERQRQILEDNQTNEISRAMISILEETRDQMIRNRQFTQGSLPPPQMTRSSELSPNFGLISVRFVTTNPEEEEQRLIPRSTRDVENKLGRYNKFNSGHESIQNEDNCTICQNPYCENEAYRELECKHIFHKKCVDKWFKKGHNKCPLCRHDIF